MPRLAISLVVRDEIELISANINFHAAQGVDAFFVMDNGSPTARANAYKNSSEPTIS